MTVLCKHDIGTCEISPFLYYKPPMKLDATDLRYVTSEEFRVLTAVSLLVYYFQFTIHWSHRWRWALKITKLFQSCLSLRYPV